MSGQRPPLLNVSHDPPGIVMRRSLSRRSSRRRRSPRSPRPSPRNGIRSPKTKAERSGTSDDDGDAYSFGGRPSQGIGFHSSINLHDSRHSLDHMASSSSDDEASLEGSIFSPSDSRIGNSSNKYRLEDASDFESNNGRSSVALEPVLEDSSSPARRNSSILTPATDSTGDFYSSRQPAVLGAPQPTRRVPIKLGSSQQMQPTTQGSESESLDLADRSTRTNNDVLYATSKSSKYDMDRPSSNYARQPSRRKSEALQNPGTAFDYVKHRRSSLNPSSLMIEVPQREPSYIKENTKAAMERPYPADLASPNKEVTDAENDLKPQPNRQRRRSVSTENPQPRSQPIPMVKPTPNDIAADYLPNQNRRRDSIRALQQGRDVYLSDDGTARPQYLRHDSGDKRRPVRSPSTHDMTDALRQSRHMSSEMEAGPVQGRRRSMTATTDDTKEYPQEAGTPYREMTDAEADYLPRPHRRRRESIRRQSIKPPNPSTHIAESDSDSRRAGSMYEAESKTPKTDDETVNHAGLKNVASGGRRVGSISERPASGAPSMARRLSDSRPLSDTEDGTRSNGRDINLFAVHPSSYRTQHPITAHVHTRKDSALQQVRWTEHSDRGYDSYTESRRFSRASGTNKAGSGGGRRRGSSIDRADAPKPVFVFKDVSAEDSNRKPLLEGVTGFMHEGEIMAVMGLSGGGKTTFLRGLTTPKTDSNLSYTSQMLARPGMRVGFVGDEYLLLEHLTVQETVRYSILLDSPSLDEERLQKRLNRWIRQMDLTEAANRQVKFLSAGQRKRVQVLQLLVKSCNMMILDEPLTALDSLTALNLMRELRRLANEERINIILSLHQPRSQIFECLDFVLVMHLGRMAYFGPAFNALDRVLGFLQRVNRESFKQLPKPGSLEKEGMDEFQSILATTDPSAEQAHLLLDLLAATSSMQAKSKRNKAIDVCDMFKNSDSYKVLLKTVAEMIENPNSELETYAVGDIAIAKGGFVWKRSWLASARFMTDMSRDKNSWIVNVFTAALLTLCIGFMWYGLGGDPSLDFPTAQGAFFYTLSAGLFALVQLPVPRFCTLYNLYRQESVDGTHTAEQMMIEAVLCTTPLPIFYAIISIVPYFMTFSTTLMNWTLLSTNILLALTAQLLGWFFVFAFNGDVVLSLSSFMGIETIMLASDGFVVPPAWIRTPWIYAYLVNIRTWYLKANMIDLLCGSSCGSATDSIQSSLSSVQEQLAYEWPTGSAGNTQIDTVVDSYLKAFFDLTGYSVSESITYSVYITLGTAVLAVITLYGARWIYSDKLRRQGQGDSSWMRWRSFFTVNAIVHGFSIMSVLLVLVLSGLFGDTGAKSISETYAKSSSVGYSSTVQTVCPLCMGIPNEGVLYTDLLSLADYQLFTTRFDVSFRTLLDSTKNADELCDWNNYFHPTSTQLAITSVDDMFSSYMPRAVAGMVGDMEKLVNLEHAEGRLARIWTEVISADILERVSALPVQFSGEDEIEGYLMDTYGQTMEDALDEGRLYQFVRMEGVDDEFRIDDSHRVRNPYILFYRNSSDEDLHTVAVRLSTIATVLTPEAPGYTWPAAAALARNAITFKAMLHHFIHIHHVGTAVGVALEDSFGKSHAMYQLLFPFRDRLRYFATVNDALDVSFPLVGLTLPGQVDLLSKTEPNFNFARDLDYAAVSATRGLDDNNDGLFFPLRPLTQHYWQAASNYSADVVDFLYPTDASVSKDKSVQKWAKKMQASDGGNIQHLTTSPCGICDRVSLKELLERLIFSTLSHSSMYIASRVGELMFYPFSAPSLRTNTLPSTTEMPESEYLEMFSDSDAILEALHYFHKGSTMVQLPLHKWPSAVSNSRLQQITQSYVDNVYNIAGYYEELLDETIVSRLEGTVVL